MDTSGILLSNPTQPATLRPTPESRSTSGVGRVAIVTGATGFIGGAVASRLRDQGRQVRCSVGKARRLLRFEAAIDLTGGLARTARWYIEHAWVRPVRTWP